MGVLQVLDLVIGLSFVYLLLSFICITLQEIKSNIRKERSNYLKDWIYYTFQMDAEVNQKDKTASALGKAVWENQLIDGLTQKGEQASYIPKEVFVNALLDEIHHQTSISPVATPSTTSAAATTQTTTYDFESIGTSITNSQILPERMKRLLAQMHAEAHSNLDSFREQIGDWYDHAMERNMGTFKKYTQRWVLLISFIVTIGLNVDTIKLIKYFHSYPQEATRIADAAEEMMKQNPELPKPDKDKLNEYIDKVNSLELPMGWKMEKVVSQSGCWITRVKKTLWSIILVIGDNFVGWIITAFAVSLGAPFWFDALNKLVNIRSTGRRIATAGESKDSEKPTTDNAIA
jgi:hypothetical protein